MVVKKSTNQNCNPWVNCMDRVAENQTTHTLCYECNIGHFWQETPMVKTFLCHMIVEIYMPIGDMIEVFKIITGKYDKKWLFHQQDRWPLVTHTRGNTSWLNHGNLKYDLRKHSLIIRFISIRNSLPNNVKCCQC